MSKPRTEFSAFLQSLYDSWENKPLSKKSSATNDFFRELIQNAVIDKKQNKKDVDDLLNHIQFDMVNRIFSGRYNVARGTAYKILREFSEDNFSRYIENRENFNQENLLEKLKNTSVPIPDGYSDSSAGRICAAYLRQYLKEMADKKGNLTQKQAKQATPSLPGAEPYIISYQNAFPSDPIGVGSILERLYATIAAAPHFAILCGRNGIGKKTICQAFLQQYGAQYSTVVYMRYHDSLVQTVCEDVSIENFNRKLTPNGEPESRGSYFKRKLEVIKRISANHPILFVLVDYDPPASENNIEEWNSLRSLLEIGKASFLITTSRQLTDKELQNKSVSASLDTETLKDIFFRNYTASTIRSDDPLLTKLIEDCLGNHTLAVKLTAKYLMSTRSDLGGFLDSFNRDGLHSMDSGTVRLGDFDRTDTPAKAIASLFNLFDLHDNEKKILNIACLCSPSPIQAEDMLKWASMPNLDTAMSLYSKGWLDYNSQTDAFSVNPIVKETVLYHCTVLLSDYTGFLLKMTSDLTKQDQLTWNSERKQYCAHLVHNILSHSNGLSIDLLPFFIAAERLLVYGGMRDQSYNLNLALDDYLSQDHINKPLELAIIRYYRGWTLITQRRRPQEGLQLLLNAQPMMESSANRDDPEQCSYLSDLYADIGLQFARSGDERLQGEAAGKIEYAITLLNSDNDMFIRRKCWLKGLLAECYITGKQLDKAKDSITEGYDLYRELEKNARDPQIIRLYQANLLLREGMISRVDDDSPEKALNKYLEAQQIYDTYYGELYPSNINHFLLIANQYEACGIDGAAKEYRMRALRVAKSVFDENSPVVKSCQEALRIYRNDGEEESICQQC